MATHKPRLSGMEKVLRGTSSDVYMIEANADPTPAKQEMQRTLTPDPPAALANTQKSESSDTEESINANNDSQQEPDFYCICGKPLKRYPLREDKSRSNLNLSVDEPDGFMNAFRGFKQFVMERRHSLTEIDRDLLLGEANNEQKEEEKDPDTSQKPHESTDSKQAVATADIEDQMTAQIELQRNESSNKQQPETPKDLSLKLDEMLQTSDLPQHVYHDDESDDETPIKTQEEEQKEDGTHSDQLVEDSVKRQAAETAALKHHGVDSMYSNSVAKVRDDVIKVRCHSCDGDLNDEKDKRYECDDSKIYTKKELHCHVQYCSKCYHQLKKLMNLRKRDEKYIFREDGFEIRTETAKAEAEPSITETEKSGPDTTTTDPTDTTNNPLNKSQQNMLSPTNSMGNRDGSPSPSPQSSPFGFDLFQYVKQIDFYKFHVKMKKLHIDHADKRRKKTKHGDEKEEKYPDDKILYPWKSVICYPTNDNDPDRVCYISVELNHLSISEKWETGNAECDIQLTVKLYWMLSESDYVQYNELKRKNKSSLLSFAVNDIKFAFKPKVDFHSAIGNKEHQEQQHVRLVKLDEFFGDKVLTNLHMKRKSRKEKDHPWDNIRKLLFGYMAEVTYNCEIKIYEPFEIENFPFDCQDIPIVIEPDNFQTLAPAYFGRTDRAFVTVTGDATNLGRWSMENTISEFNNNKRNKRNALRIMLKLKRYSSPYLLEHGFLIMLVCLVSLSSFTIDAIGHDMKHERLAIVLGLILTLIFIDLPNVPRVTLLHWYFYMSFVFLILLAFHIAVGTYYGKTLLQIVDPDCYNSVFETNDEELDWDDCAWYQKHYYNAACAITFGALFLIEHIIFLIVFVVVNADENRKLQMSSGEIKNNVENDQFQILTSSAFKSENNPKKKDYFRYNNSIDLFGGYQKIVEGEGDSSYDRMKNTWQKKHNEFNRNKTKLSHIIERLTVLIFVIASFIILPPTVSILQFYVIESDLCSVELSFKMEQFVMILASCAQALLCLVCVLFWFGCCIGGCAQLMFKYSLVTVMVVIVGNYVLAIRSYVDYHWQEVQCTGYYRQTLQWLFGAWIVIYGLMFFFTFIKISFTRGYIEARGYGKSLDSNVVLLRMIADSFKSRYTLRSIKKGVQYFTIKLFTATVPVMVQYPATVILLILLGDSCTKGNPFISQTESIALMVLSLILNLTRSILQGNNSFFYNFTYFMIASVPVNILSIRALVFAEMYKDNAQCKESRLYGTLYGLMIVWVLYDNISIVGIILEFVLGYAHTRRFEFKQFTSTLIAAIVLGLQLPAFVGQYYMIVKNEVRSPIELTPTYCILCIAIIWMQVLIYRIMQSIPILREYVIIPMFLFVSFIFLISMKSFAFWVMVDTTTAASVMFAVVFMLCIIADVILLAPATFVIPIVAYWAYRGCCVESGMFRSMVLLFIMFILVQLPCCILQLIPIWKGEVKTISHWEGEILLLLTWGTLIIQFFWTYIHFDTNHSKQKKVHPNIKLKDYKNYVKYFFLSVLSLVWIIAIHCFLAVKQDMYGGLLWYLFIIWFAEYIVITTAPSFNIIWHMFCRQREIRRWLNNAYVLYAVIIYFIQLAACIFQLYMIEFGHCTNRIGHTLDRSTAESFAILSFTFIRMIGFYTLADVLGWTDEHDDKIEDEENRKDMKEVELGRRALTQNYNCDDFAELGFKSKSEMQDAVTEKTRALQTDKWKRRWREYNGPIFYVSVPVICVIQFGLAVHSFGYWNANDNEIHCTDNSKKNVCRVLFWAWIIADCLGVAGGLVVGAFRRGLDIKAKRQKANQEKRKAMNAAQKGKADFKANV
eukprot:654788_1